jgi:hypothetical protein
MRRPPNYTPMVGMRVRRLIGANEGRVLTVESVRPLGGDIYNISGYYDGATDSIGGDAENFELETAVTLTPDSSSQFFVGQEVVISERVTGVGGRDCEVASNYIGQHVTIRRVTPTTIDFEWNNGSSRWQLQPKYLDLPKPPTQFNALWQIVRSGQHLQSMLEPLWEWIMKPVESLSRIKGDWNSLIPARAVLRLRRQVPNNYEEEMGKVRGWGSNVWNCVWQAVLTYEE